MIFWNQGFTCQNPISLLSVNDPGIIYGHHIFETLLLYKGKLVAGHEHILRLLTNCDKAFLARPHTHTFEKLVHDLSTLDQKWSRIRLHVVGTEDPQHSFFFADVQETQKKYLTKTLATVVDDRSSLRTIKSTNYLPTIIQQNIAREKHFQDILYVSDRVHESSFYNFIFKINNHYYLTESKHKLRGITESIFGRLTNAHEKILLTKDLKNITSCALISSVTGIQGIAQIDEYSFSTEEWPVMQDRLWIEFQELANSFEWDTDKIKLP